MIQSLDIPVVSLSVPNIHKLDAITSDDLSCMWTVFTKCKNNLENGSRLENMSWRLWYRETLIEKAQKQHARTPIPIQQTSTTSEEKADYFSYASSTSSTSTCSILQTPSSLKHVSTSSFKRMISSLNSPIEPHTLISPVPHLPAAAAAAELPRPSVHVLPSVTTTRSAAPPSPTTTVVVVHPLPEKAGITAAEPPAKIPTTILIAPKPTTARTSKFFLFDDDEDDESDNDDSLTNTCDNDDGFWSTVRSEGNNFQQTSTALLQQPARPNSKTSDFAKRLLTPAPLPCRRSLLTSMLTANPINPMARPRRIGQRKRLSNDTELSQSLRYCVDWEQQQNAYFDEFMAPPITANESSAMNNHWDNFQGW